MPPTLKSDRVFTHEFSKVDWFWLESVFCDFWKILMHYRWSSPVSLHDRCLGSEKSGIQSVRLFGQHDFTKPDNIVKQSVPSSCCSRLSSRSSSRSCVFIMWRIRLLWHAAVGSSSCEHNSSARKSFAKQACLSRALKWREQHTACGGRALTQLGGGLCENSQHEKPHSPCDRKTEERRQQQEILGKLT